MFGAAGYVLEEKWMGDSEDLDPFLMAGIEGLWALLLWSIALPILQIIPCSSEGLCQNGVVEDSLGALHEYGLQPLHFVWSTAVTILIPIC